MKGQTESYSFLIGIIITLLILVPISIWGYSAVVGGAETKDCFNALSEKIPKLNNLESGVEICNTANEKAIIIFSPGGYASEYFSPDYVGDNPYETSMVNYHFTNNFEKCKDKSCICLCDFSGKKPEVCGDAENEICTVIDWVKGVKGSIAVSEKTASENRIIDLAIRNHFLLNSEQQALPVYFERQGYILGVCFSSPCLAKAEGGQICTYECNTDVRSKTKESCELASCQYDCQWVNNKCYDLCTIKCSQEPRFSLIEACNYNKCTNIDCVWDGKQCNVYSATVDLLKKEQ